MYIPPYLLALIVLFPVGLILWLNRTKFGSVVKTLPVCWASFVDLTGRYAFQTFYACALSALYAGQLFILSGVALRNKPTTFWDLILKEDAQALLIFLAVLGLSLIAFWNELACAGALIMRLRRPRSTTRRFPELKLSDIALGIAVAIVFGLIVGQDWQDVRGSVGGVIRDEAIKLVILFTAAVGTPILISWLLNPKYRETTPVHIAVENWVASIVVLTLLAWIYWYMCGKIIDRNQLSEEVESALRYVLMKDTFMFWMLSCVAVLPFIRFKKCFIENRSKAGTIAIPFVTLLICAWMQTFSLDYIYLFEVEKEGFRFHEVFPRDWQFTQVASWIHLREGLLALMIVVAVLWLAVEFLFEECLVVVLAAPTTVEPDQWVNEISCDLLTLAGRRDWPIKVSNTATKVESQCCCLSSAKDSMPNPHLYVTISQRRLRWLMNQLACDSSRKIKRSWATIALAKNALLITLDGRVTPFILEDKEVAELKQNPSMFLDPQALLDRFHEQSQASC